MCTFFFFVWFFLITWSSRDQKISFFQVLKLFYMWHIAWFANLKFSFVFLNHLKVEKIFFFSIILVAKAEWFTLWKYAALRLSFKHELLYAFDCNKLLMQKKKQKNCTEQQHAQTLSWWNWKPNLILNPVCVFASTAPWTNLFVAIVNDGWS